MKSNKVLFVFSIIFFIGFIAAIIGSTYLFYVNKQQSLTIDKQENLLDIHEGNTFNLRDDIAVLQDSLRLIRVGQISIEIDSTNNFDDGSY